MSPVHLPPPIWIRMPKPVKDADGNVVAPARCYWTGLSAAKLYAICVPCKANGFKPPVRSISVPNDGETPAPDAESTRRSKKNTGSKHVRLVHLPSLLAYLDSLPSSTPSH